MGGGVRGGFLRGFDFIILLYLFYVLTDRLDRTDRPKPLLSSAFC